MNILAEIIIKYLNPKFDKSDVYTDEEFLGLNFAELHRKLYINGVDIAFLQQLEKFHPDVYEVFPYKNYLENELEVVATMELLSQLSADTGIDCMYFKTIAPFEFTKGDLDIYFKDEKDFVVFEEGLKKLDFSDGHKLLAETEFNKKGHIKVDLHHDITWDYMGRGGQGPTLLDLNDFWETRIKTTYKQMLITVPSIENEIMVVAAHTAFQHHYLTLGDGLYIGELIRNNEVDFEHIFGVTKKYGWQNVMREILQVVKAWYKQNWKIDLNIPVKARTVSPNSLIYVQPLTSILTSYNQPENTYLPIKLAVSGLLAGYRYFRYIKFKEELPFNPYDY